MRAAVFRSSRVSQCPRPRASSAVGLKVTKIKSILLLAHSPLPLLCHPRCTPECYHARISPWQLGLLLVTPKVVRVEPGGIPSVRHPVATTPILKLDLLTPITRLVCGLIMWNHIPFLGPEELKWLLINWLILKAPLTLPPPWWERVRSTPGRTWLVCFIQESMTITALCHVSCGGHSLSNPYKRPLVCSEKALLYLSSCLFITYNYEWATVNYLIHILEDSPAVLNKGYSLINYIFLN